MSVFLTDIIPINHDTGTANTESAIKLPPGIYELRLQARSAVDLLVAWVQGATASGGPCWTVKSGTVYRLERMSGAPKTGDGAGPTLFVRCVGTANVVVEIECLK